MLIKQQGNSFYLEQQKKNGRTKPNIYFKHQKCELIPGNIIN